MPTITFQPNSIQVDVESGTSLVEAAKTAGVEIQVPCGGKGTCGKCIVKVNGAVDSDSLGVLSQTAVADGYVLACKTKALTTDLEVEIPEVVGRQGGQFTSASEDSSLVMHELFPKNWQFDPLAVKWFLEVPEPQLEDGLSDVDRVTRCLQRDWGKKEIIFPLSIMQKLAGMLRENGGQVTTTMIREADKYRIVDVEAGNTASQQYGICVDIGTTTVAVQLVYLPLAKAVTAVTDYNDQIACGLDVISRISYARTPERLEELRVRIVETINKLIMRVADQHEITPQQITNAVVSGNTTMIHLLLGLDPEHIRLDPYTPTLLSVPFLPAKEIGITISPESWIYISPSVGSYVGGDITAGILCTDLAANTEDVSLFIDIGTNGELVIGNCDFMMTCACSAGPAFEGGGIEYGMRAAVGAIERVEVDPETGKAMYWTIGNVRPKGICGSGMITLIANLFLTGWLDAAGKLNRDKASLFIQVNGRTASYVIAPEDETDVDGAIVISELDIENIIRAKAAIYSACAMMLEQVGMEFEDLSTVYIAGGFGRFLDLEMAKVIGLIPDLPAERFKYIGNSSLTGSYMVLVAREFQEKQEELANRMTYVELSTDPSYMDQYTGALFLPHTDPRRFPNVSVL
ncbi:hypothetical protein BVY04_01925 [bacterium M21]|nr:hypothetical protein BVY04_01925 [bacterium M21]